MPNSNRLRPSQTRHGDEPVGGTGQAAGGHGRILTLTVIPATRRRAACAGTLTRMSSDLRYPVGEFVATAPFTAAQRAAAIKTLAELPARMRLAVRRPRRRAARHAVPARRLDGAAGGAPHRRQPHPRLHPAEVRLSEDNPTIKPYPEAVWAEMADARTAPVALVAAICSTRCTAVWCCVLGSLDAAAFARTLFHPERGAMSHRRLPGALRLALPPSHRAHHQPARARRLVT